ncbi:MAG: alpha-glucosidase C-terminal domain-containing protein [Muribaculaceae bacterium]|nr:alpha-glucosidase C-terminal domain-containing protein [Muribaculaceae bacterium]
MNPLKHLAAFATGIAALVSCTSTTTTDTVEPVDYENRVVYSVYLRNYTNPDSAGTFKDLQADLPRLRDLGVDVIHLLPFYTMGEENAKGSPYCIRDYNNVDPRYGTIDDLRELVDSIHAGAMEIWFDWVGNHTAYDHPWVKEHPEWYTERQDFDDVRSVNSENPELRAAMAESMKFWVEECGIDGYRCDFAHGPGRDFWMDIIGQVDPEHKLFWLAEGDEGGIANDWLRAEGGPFDSRYGWTYSEYLYKDANNHRESVTADGFDKALFHMGYPVDRSTFLAYIGSHDIYQGMGDIVSPATQDAIYGDNLKPFTVMTMLAPGIPMVYMGQEINYSKPGGVGIMKDTEAIDWSNVDEDYLALVKELIKLRHTQPALATVEGILVVHPTDNDSVLVFERRNGDNSLLAAINFSYNPVTFTVTSPAVPRNVYTNVFDGSTTALTKPMTLAGKGYAVYTKGSEALDADLYTVGLKLPADADAAVKPTVRIFTEDPLGTGGAIDILPLTEMTAGADGTYTVLLPYLPAFGYTVALSDTPDHTVLRTETVPVSRTYTIGADGEVAVVE